MDTELLKTFLEVNRTRHFGHAAEHLYISQSAVSARIRQLEDLVGVALFTRTRNDIQLTPAGVKLVPHAERMLNSWNRARQEIVLEDESQVPLAIAGAPSLWDMGLQEWLHWMYREAAGIALQAEVLSQEMLMRRLMDGTLDVACLFESPQLAPLHVVEIFRAPLVMVASTPGLSAQQAITENYVLVDWGTSFTVAHARHFPDMTPPSMRVGLGRVARSLLLQCGGAAYLARPMVEELLRDGRLHPVEDAPEIERCAYAAYPVQSEKIAVIERLLNYFGQRPASAARNQSSS
jgi:DNA-binding transcriptional LysR family regulator